MGQILKPNCVCLYEFDNFHVPHYILRLIFYCCSDDIWAVSINIDKFIYSSFILDVVEIIFVRIGLWKVQYHDHLVDVISISYGSIIVDLKWFIPVPRGDTHLIKYFFNVFVNKHETTNTIVWVGMQTSRIDNGI